MALEHFYSIKEKKKNSILNAIEKCMQEHNYDELSINDIVVKAEISRGSFYNYFADKNDAVETLVQERMKIIFDSFKECIKENDGRLFDGVYEGYKRVKTVLKDEIFLTIMKNLKFFTEIGTKIIYSKEYDKELKELLDWLITNTVEGKEKLNTREKMANIVDLFISLITNVTLRMLIMDQNDIDNDGFDYKFKIIKNGVMNIE